IFRNRVEVTFQIRIHYPDIPFNQQLFDTPKCIVAATSTSKAEAPFMERVVKDWFQDMHQRRLHDAVTNCRYTQRTLFVAAWLGDLNATNRQRTIDFVA